MLGITRETKRLIVLVIVTLIFIAFGMFVYFATRPEPTCFDGKENQNEVGVDCGGVCQKACVVRVEGDDLLVKETTWISDPSGRFDALAEIYNPNEDIGAERFVYTIVLRDLAGRELARERGVSSILPLETKTLLAFELSAGTTPSRVTLDIEEIVWKSLPDYRERPQIDVYEKRYEAITSGVGFSKVTGKLANRSPYDFQAVTIKVVLRDADGRALAVNQNEMRTITVGMERDFQILWPQAFEGVVTRIDAEVDADIYRSENFIKRYLPGGQYQDLRTP